MKKDNHRRQINIYLSESEKEILDIKAKHSSQPLARYIRNCLLKRVNKAPITPEIITDRILLSEIKGSVMTLINITTVSNCDSHKQELLNELNKLDNIIDGAINKSMGVENDSSNLPEE